MGRIKAKKAKQDKAATKIQSVGRGYLGRIKAKKAKEAKQAEAAKKFNKFFRRIILKRAEEAKAAEAGDGTEAEDAAAEEDVKNRHEAGNTAAGTTAKPAEESKHAEDAKLETGAPEEAGSPAKDDKSKLDEILEHVEVVVEDVLAAAAGAAEDLDDAAVDDDDAAAKQAADAKALAEVAEDAALDPAKKDVIRPTTAPHRRNIGSAEDNPRPATAGTTRAPDVARATATATKAKLEKELGDLKEELKLLETFPGLNTDGKLKHDSRRVAWQDKYSDPKSPAKEKNPQFFRLFNIEDQKALKSAIEAATQAAQLLTESLNETLTQLNASLENALEQLNAGDSNDVQSAEENKGKRDELKSKFTKAKEGLRDKVVEAAKKKLADLIGDAKDEENAKIEQEIEDKITELNELGLTSLEDTERLVDQIETLGDFFEGFNSKKGSVVNDIVVENVSEEDAEAEEPPAVAEPAEDGVAPADGDGVEPAAHNEANPAHEATPPPTPTPPQAPGRLNQTQPPRNKTG